MIGSYIDGNYISQGCQNCKFWTENRREGVCSQKVKTTEGIFMNQVVPFDYVCATHEDDDIKTEFRFFIKKDDSVAISGTYSRNSLLKMKEYIDEKLKDL